MRVCKLCQSDEHLSEASFGATARIWICTACYNNAVLRDQIKEKFRQLFAKLQDDKVEASEKLKALARQYKMPEPEI